MSGFDVVLREASTDDLAVMQRVLACAIEWRLAVSSGTPESIIERSGHSYLLAGWGRAGDVAVVADVDGAPVGAAWYRHWTDELHSYGYVDPVTPEIAIGVEPQWRRKGIGTALIEALVRQAIDRGVPGLCLSVESDNPALVMYERAGFERYELVEASWTMVKSLRQ